MSDLSNLKFQSGRSVLQVKKDAKRLKKSSGITLTEALNQCAKKNGSLPWDQSIKELKRRALFESMLEEQLVFEQNYMPSVKVRDLMNKAICYPPKLPYASLKIDLSKLPSHVYETLLCHPFYNRFIERFMRYSVFNLQIKHPDSKEIYNGEDDWRFDITFDGFSGDGNKPFNDTWELFRCWIMQFASSQRVNITERVNRPSYSTIVIQTNLSWTTLDFVNKLEFDVDKAFYILIANDKSLIEKVQWRNTDLSVLNDLRDQSDSHQDTALFEYMHNGKTETVATKIQGSVREHNTHFQAIQLYTSAVNSVMSHYKLIDPIIQIKLLNIGAS